MNGVIFSRVSSKNDRQNNERQILQLQDFAVANKINVVKIFSEKISGATKNRERKVLQECLSFVKNEKIDIILVSELSRLGRNIFEVMEIVKFLADNKINAYIKNENLYILNEKGEVSPLTKMLLMCLGMCAELERESIKFRLNSGREIAIMKGVKMGRPANTKMSSADREKKYSKVIKLLRKGMTVKEVITICKADGIKVGEATIWNLKKEFCKEKTHG